MIASSTVSMKFHEAAKAVQTRCGIQPQIALVLGSGLGSLVEHLTEAVTIPYTEIPHFHGTSVEGHAGKLAFGYFQKIPVVALQGRFHLYEGYPMTDVVLPTRMVCALGIQTLILTNAAGGLNSRFRPGDLMIIEDHINLMGDNPLKGPNLAEMGPRFPDLSEAYSRDCNQILFSAAEERKMDLHRGVYVGLLGPTYETPAEVRMLRALGGDAVGMSTVPETIAANHLGVRVCGISCITNLAAGLSNSKLTHREVMEYSKVGSQKLSKLLEIAIPKMVHGN